MDQYLSYHYNIIMKMSNYVMNYMTILSVVSNVNVSIARILRNLRLKGFQCSIRNVQEVTVSIQYAF